MIGETRSKHTSFQPSRAIRASRSRSRGRQATRVSTAGRNSERHGRHLLGGLLRQSVFGRLRRLSGASRLRGDQFDLRNTLSMIPAGIGRTSREIGPPLKVPVMPKVCASRVARCAIGASYGTDRIASSANP